MYNKIIPTFVAPELFHSSQYEIVVMNTIHVHIFDSCEFLVLISDK
jgi:hypothetical protein